MGTRSITTFVSKYQGEETPLVSVYQPFDGYIEGFGHELARWLLKKKIINGIRSDQYTEEFANGVDCLAAQFIRDHKTRVGDLYIYPTGHDPKWVDFSYRVVVSCDQIPPSEGIPLNDITEIRVTNWDNEKPFFVGTPKELLEYQEEDDE